METMPLDRRKQRTRSAAQAAFTGLLFEQGYETITVPEVARRAGLGRSTLYEHFRTPEALLEASLAGPIGVLAAPRPDLGGLQRLLDHLRAEAGAVRILLAQPLRSRIAAMLATRIGARLRAEGVPGPLADARASAAAEGQLALLAFWLRSHGVDGPAMAAELVRLGYP